MRHALLYADQQWRRQRFIVYFGFVYCVGFIFYFVVIQHIHDLGTLLSMLAVLVFVALMFLIFQANRLRSFVQVTDSGLKVQRLLRSEVVDYDRIKGLRVQPLRSVTGESKGMTPIIKALLDRPTLVMRLSGDEEELAALRKQLNRPLSNRLLYDSTLVLPVDDAEGASEEIAARLPIRVNSNLGGAKRHKRRR